MAINWSGCASRLLTHNVACIVSWCNCAAHAWFKKNRYLNCYIVNCQSEFLYITHKSSTNVGYVVSWCYLSLESRCLGLEGWCLGLGLEIWYLDNITAKLVDFEIDFLDKWLEVIYSATTALDSVQGENTYLFIFACNITSIACHQQEVWFVCSKAHGSPAVNLAAVWQYLVTRRFLQ